MIGFDAHFSQRNLLVRHDLLRPIARMCPFFRHGGYPGHFAANDLIS